MILLTFSNLDFVVVAVLEIPDNTRGLWCTADFTLEGGVALSALGCHD